MEDKKALGKFVWHDLMTLDPAKAREFYSSLFGWTYEEVDRGKSKYPMIHVAGENHGGIVNLDPAAGLPSHWISYVTVDDVDAVAVKAEELGGIVPEKPMDIPDVGRFVVTVSPNRAALAAYKPKEWGGEGYEGPARPGTFVWFELLSLDPEADGSFFGEIYGWNPVQNMTGPYGPYYLFKRKDRPDKDAGGMVKRPETSGSSIWFPYIGVEDVDATAARIEPLGGKIWVRPTDVPGVARFAVVADPTGAMFGIYR